jgi:hypothetical protein
VPSIPPKALLFLGSRKAWLIGQRSYIKMYEKFRNEMRKSIFTICGVCAGFWGLSFSSVSLRDGVYDLGEVEIGIGRGREGVAGVGVAGWGILACFLRFRACFLRFRCLFQGWPFSRLAGIEGKRFLLDMGRFWWSRARPRSGCGRGWKLGQGRVAEGYLGSGGRRWPSLAGRFSCLAVAAMVLKVLRC